MDVSFFTMLESLYTRVNETATNVLENVDDENLKAQYLKELEEVLVSGVTCEHKVAISRQAVKEAITRAKKEETDEPDADLYDDLVEESIGELEMDSPLEGAVAQAECLKSFKEMLKQNNDNSGEDLITIQCSSSFIDPITKKRMTDPVRNKKCGHVYDKNSITAMISARSKHGVKCPAIGCANREVMKLSDLEEALDVKRQLKLQQRKERMQ